MSTSDFFLIAIAIYGIALIVLSSALKKFCSKQCLKAKSYGLLLAGGLIMGFSSGFALFHRLFYGSTDFSTIIFMTGFISSAIINFIFGVIYEPSTK